MSLEPSLPWIILSYRTASETSTLRVRAWRILRRIGALSLQQSVCAVPNTAETSRKVRQLRDLIEANGGETLWLDVEPSSEETLNRLIELLNTERSQEYEAFIETCTGLASALSVTECEGELKRLQKWFRKMQARDYFNCPTAATARRRLEEVEKQVTDWQQTVHQM